MQATKTHSMHHPRRQNVTNSMVGLKKKKKKKKNAKFSPKMVNPRDLAVERRRRRSSQSGKDGRQKLPFSTPLAFSRSQLSCSGTAILHYSFLQQITAVTLWYRHSALLFPSTDHSCETRVPPSSPPLSLKRPQL